MVRSMQETDRDRVAEIWLAANLEAHAFISAQYWQGHYEAVKKMLSQAEVYVYEEEADQEIQGFIGLDGDYIAGIFVQSEARSVGVGRRLLAHIRRLRSRLYLHVYQKNMRAVKFYLREGFRIQGEGQDGETGEREYEMVWQSSGIYGYPKEQALQVAMETCGRFLLENDILL